MSKIPWMQPVSLNSLSTSWVQTLARPQAYLQAEPELCPCCHDHAQLSVPGDPGTAQGTSPAQANLNSAQLRPIPCSLQHYWALDDRSAQAQQAAFPKADLNTNPFRLMRRVLDDQMGYLEEATGQKVRLTLEKPSLTKDQQPGCEPLFRCADGQKFRLLSPRPGEASSSLTTRALEQLRRQPGEQVLVDGSHLSAAERQDLRKSLEWEPRVLVHEPWEVPFDAQAHGDLFCHNPLQEVAEMRSAGQVPELRNLAYAELKLGPQTIPLGGVSGYSTSFTYQPDGVPVLHAVVQPTQGYGQDSLPAISPDGFKHPGPRSTDSEVEIADRVDDILKEHPGQPAKLALYTERATCDSCMSVLHKLEADHPGLQLQVFFNPDAPYATGPITALMQAAPFPSYRITQTLPG